MSLWANCLVILLQNRPNVLVRVLWVCFLPIVFLQVMVFCLLLGKQYHLGDIGKSLKG